MIVKRDWSRAQHKREEGCRICSKQPVELAHVVGRAHDERRGAWAIVNPNAVVPLCKQHHVAYDARSLDLMPYLRVEEQARAVMDAGGIESARRRISGRAA